MDAAKQRSLQLNDEIKLKLLGTIALLPKSFALHYNKAICNTFYFVDESGLNIMQTRISLFNKVTSVLAFMGFALMFNVALLACTESNAVSPFPMSSQNSPPSGDALKNSTWRLDRWERQGSTVALVPQTEVYLQFEDNRVNGSGGCNRFGGSFDLAKDKLSLGLLEATQRGCEAAVMNQESQFLSALQSVSRIVSDNSGNLVLFYTLDTVEGVLYFSPKK